jgi:excisionase family DNA binding protein
MLNRVRRFDILSNIKYKKIYRDTKSPRERTDRGVSVLRTVTKRGFSPTEVAEMLGVSHATIYREMDRGRLSSVKVGIRRVITQWDLEEYLGKERARSLLESMGKEVPSREPEQERLERIDKVMGMFAHLSDSVDDLMKEKQNGKQHRSKR